MLVSLKLFSYTECAQKDWSTHFCYQRDFFNAWMKIIYIVSSMLNIFDMVLMNASVLGLLSVSTLFHSFRKRKKHLTFYVLI